MDPVSALETALGAELLRADMLGGARPRITARYTVRRFLGRGATGLVVAAHDERLGRDVALKLSPAGAEEGPLAEARALARLDHPNVVRVFDAEQTDLSLDGKPFRVRLVSMQRVEGRSLRIWLRERTRTTEEIVAVLLGAGAGLAAAHAERIVHRDFKPDNVLVGDDGVAQVIDFGFAVPHRSLAGAMALDVAGTGPYLAPEAKAGHATAKTDQFSFGITLVEALTGAPSVPTGETPVGVAAGLWRLARRATDPDPSRRYRDMTTLLTALRGSASSRPRIGRGGCISLLVASACLLTAAWRPISGAYMNYRCAPLAGEWPEVRTHVDESRHDGIPVGTEGLYSLTLTHRGACEFDVRLEHTGDDGPEGSHTYRRPLETRSDRDEPVQALPLPFLPVVVSVIRRSSTPATYHLMFPTDDSVDGVFDAGTYSGHIVRMSRFGRPDGPDARSPR